jgi:folate-binding protein YgfZ
MEAIFLPERSLIRLSGEETKTFLQGITTNDIEKLVPGNLQYSLHLTPQGKFLYDFFIFTSSDYYIDILTSRKDEIIAALKHYRMRSKIEIIDVSDQYLVAQSFKEISTDGFCFEDPRSKEMGCRLYVPKLEAKMDHSEYDKKRLKLRLPEAETELESGKSMALEYHLDNFNAISFDKGCYVGQELMARTHFQGVVRKKLYIVSSDDSLPEKGTDITLQGKKIGVLGEAYNNVALALIKTESLEEGEEIYTGTIKLKIEKEDE